MDLNLMKTIRGETLRLTKVGALPNTNNLRKKEANN